jgi:hypothetical protein
MSQSVLKNMIDSVTTVCMKPASPRNANTVGISSSNGYQSQ